MNLPPTVPATANSIIVQFRACANKDTIAKNAADINDHFTIPPMSIVYKVDTPAREHISNVSAHSGCFSGSVPARNLFKGVSLAGINGAEARRFKNNDRLSVITRGEATIAVPWNDVKDLTIGALVQVKVADKQFKNFSNTRQFSIESTTSYDASIGKLIRKPNRRHPENWATVLLE